MFPWLLIGLTSGAAATQHHPVLDLVVAAARVSEVDVIGSSRVLELDVAAAPVTDLEITALPTEVL